jgi:hypothetical protein
LPNGVNGIDSGNAKNVVIGGTAPHQGNLVSGNHGIGIYIYFTSSVQIQGNLVGTDITGTQSLGNGLSGIRVDSQNELTTIIGGIVPAARNIVSTNTGTGITGGPGIIEGNYIGTDVTGTQPLGNAQGGITGTWQIGDTVAGSRNIISANSQFERRLRPFRPSPCSRDNVAASPESRAPPTWKKTSESAATLVP